MRRVLLGAALLVGGGVGLGAVALHTYEAPGPAAEPIVVVVPRGSVSDIGGVLARAGVIRAVWSFRLSALATWPEGPLRAAELRFPAGASLAAVLAVLREGRPVQHRLTLVEGVTAAQAAQVVAAADGLVGRVVVPPEGALLPQTYLYERGMRADGVLAEARTAMSRALRRAWEGRARDVPLGSMRDAVILASIVEREARLPQERPMIARVFFNRLSLHMRLQADATTVYGASGGLSLGRSLSRADLDRSDAYNTYFVDGLPAGPICAPGLASIEAVLHPAVGDALYFVVDGSGGHVFSSTLAAHNANVARYRAVGR